MNDPVHPSPIPGADAPDSLIWPDSTDPIWMATAPTDPFPRLDGNLEADVAIVGGGIAGLTAASLLKQAGRRVVVIEALQVAQGESGRTTAHLTAYPDPSLRTLVNRFGRARVRAMWASQEQAIRHIEETVRRLAIDCDFRRVPGVRFTEQEAGVRELAGARRGRGPGRGAVHVRPARRAPVR
jgi:glycine/D-amino acid oxidase-like deaminating enzyme